MNQTNKVATKLKMEPNSSLTSTDLSENSRENGVKKERDHVGMAKRLGNGERGERTSIIREREGSNLSEVEDLTGSLFRLGSFLLYIPVSFGDERREWSEFEWLTLAFIYSQFCVVYDICQIWDCATLFHALYFLFFSFFLFSFFSFFDD